MNECHRLGIKNFKSIRHPRQIKLEFDLCTDDILAPRSVSSKGDDYDKKIQISENFPIDNPSREYQYSEILVNFIIKIFYLIFRVLCIMLKYTICLTWCLFKIFFCTIFRILTKSKMYCPEGLICYSIRCHHHHH